MRTGNGALSPLAFQATPTVPGRVDGEAQFINSVHTCRLEKMLEARVPLPSMPSSCKVCVEHGIDAGPLICFWFPASGSAVVVELSSTMQAASLRLLLSDVVAVEAVAGMRRKRDLLVLHNDGRLELYCGSKPVWNVSLRTNPAQSEKYINLLQMRVPMYSGAEGSATSGALSATPAIVGLKCSNGDRLTLRLQSGIDVRVGLPFNPLGTVAAELLGAVQEDRYRQDHDISKTGDRKACDVDPSGTLVCEFTTLMSLLGALTALSVGAVPGFLSLLSPFLGACWLIHHRIYHCEFMQAKSMR